MNANSKYSKKKNVNSDTHVAIFSYKYNRYISL